MNWASVKGIFYMLVIAALFGLWWQNPFAAAFMFCFLLLVDKLLRVHLHALDQIHTEVQNTCSDVEVIRDHTEYLRALAQQGSFSVVTRTEEEAAKERLKKIDESLIPTAAEIIEEGRRRVARERLKK